MRFGRGPERDARKGMRMAEQTVGGVSTTEIVVGDKHITLETGRLAKQASGAVLVRSGDTMVLVTAVLSKNERNVDFFPLTVDVEEGMYAAGKIPGGFIKKEGRASDRAIITARLIDRPVRPLWPKGFNKETHIVATVLSVDRSNPHDVLAILGASAALSLSEAPFAGPIGAVRVGLVDGSWVVNPTYEESDSSPVNLIVAGTADAISMVEAGSDEVDEATMPPVSRSPTKPSRSRSSPSARGRPKWAGRRWCSKSAARIG